VLFRTPPFWVNNDRQNAMVCKCQITGEIALQAERISSRSPWQIGAGFWLGR
jgi:hypothetical protein